MTDVLISKHCFLQVRLLSEAVHKRIVISRNLWPLEKLKMEHPKDIEENRIMYIFYSGAFALI